MKICIVGLGLIGGSLAKAIKKNTHESCFGIDIDRGTIAGALAQEAIDGEMTIDDLAGCDVVIVGLHPEATIKFITENADKFKKGGIVLDTCGVKGEIVRAVEGVCIENGVNFLGCHPMAGREFSGFAYSVDNLFEKASFIMTPTDRTPMRVVQEISRLAYNIGFAKVVVSSSYVKSPSLLKQAGFSAGSFKDLTRVAKLNEDMWTELFLMNRGPLVDEIEHIIARLTEYRDAIANNDAQRLHDLLKEGRELKELSNNS